MRNMNNTQRSFSREFKLQAVQQYAVGIESMAQVERELGITPGLLSKWRMQYLPELLAIPPEISTHLRIEGEDTANPGPQHVLLERIEDEGTANPGTQRVLLDRSLNISIWSKAPIVEPDWIQFYGYTIYAKEHYSIYSNSYGVHTGIDWGKDSVTVDQQHPVFGPNEGKVTKVDKNPSHYEPGYIVIEPAKYPDLRLYYGHLQDIQVEKDDVVGPETILGYLEPVKSHVHVEIRRRKDNAYINPNPYLAPGLKRCLDKLINTRRQTTYNTDKPEPPPDSGKYKS